ncbi:MAG: hypothetical protein KME23_26665 [Goleter apudmare HA4340-LM2]|nr:hypothetical protein [Goleter apudmare HA4340-LM2]
MKKVVGFLLFSAGAAPLETHVVLGFVQHLYKVRESSLPPLSMNIEDKVKLRSHLIDRNFALSEDLVSPIFQKF